MQSAGWSGMTAASVAATASVRAAPAATSLVQAERRRRAGGVVGRNNQGQLRDRGRDRRRGTCGGAGWASESALSSLSYASGNVSGSGNAVGGLVGQSDSGNSFTPTASSVLASYATGSVSGDVTNLGGLIGLAQTPTGVRPSPSFTDSYWDTERSGRSVGVGSDDEDADGSISGTETATSGVTGQTTSALQMPTGYTGIYADWNIDNSATHGTSVEVRTTLNSVPRRTSPPAFSSTAVQLSVAEDAAVGSNVGAAVTATDSDGDTLTYMVVGAGGVRPSISSAPRDSCKSAPRSTTRPPAVIWSPCRPPTERASHSRTSPSR